MILLDADVLITELRYPSGTNGVENRSFLEALIQSGQSRGVALQALLEVIGVISHNVQRAKVSSLMEDIPDQFGLIVFPDPVLYPNYLELRINDLIDEMSKKMSLGDAAQSLLIQKHAPADSVLVTWNAKHFVGKTVIPVLTPSQWLQQQQGNTP